MYQPEPGDRVRVTRHVGGKLRGSVTGVIAEMCLPHGFRLRDDESGRMRFVAGTEQVARIPGWSQTIERIS